ncbi:INO80 complex subunit 2 [Neolecta irregularis DAH-3]|uniref:INO80 complex subunit 2 n=1 Tax=Neolecta irregularis (strain DAH-3) TaxID=1198029 RepID=A0A1U7LHM7_NEOID|nr:INO80 complex subunit 2 [Neolecta irregularis DAH-3]|eukprot:OLL22149.1 INO80 complex subunit 2 [Neolecta irregularis DAH-3]
MSRRASNRIVPSESSVAEEDPFSSDLSELDSSDPGEDDDEDVTLTPGTFRTPRLKIKLNVPLEKDRIVSSNKGKGAKQRRAGRSLDSESSGDELNLADDVEMEDDVDIGDNQDVEIEFDSFESTPAPEISKMTKRQRAKVEDHGDTLLELSNAPQTRKTLTAEEQALRRSEIARKRKNHTEQKLEEEKVDTINRLLKKQAVRRKSKKIEEDVGADDDVSTAGQQLPPRPISTRWIDNKDGTVLGVPDAWLETRFGEFFASQAKIQPPKPRDRCASCGGEGKYRSIAFSGKRACSIQCLKVVEGKG